MYKDLIAGETEGEKSGNSRVAITKCFAYIITTLLHVRVPERTQTIDIKGNF